MTRHQITSSAERGGPFHKGGGRSSPRALARRLLDQVHLKVDRDGHPLAFPLTEGQASDSAQFEVLLDLGPDITPRAAVGDKGYACKANRAAARERGIAPVIPHKSNEKNRPAFFPKALYRARARIEQLVGKLKRFKRIALRCEKTAGNLVPLSHSPSDSSISKPSTGPNENG